MAKTRHFTRLALAATLFQVLPARASELPAGSSIQKAVLFGQTMDLMAFRPSDCHPRAILLVMAAKDRDSWAYRDDSIPLAQAVCGVVFSPTFPEKQFPTWQY